MKGVLTCTGEGVCSAGWRIWLQAKPNPRRVGRKTGRTPSSTAAPDPQEVVSHVGKYVQGWGYQVVGELAQDAGHHGQVLQVVVGLEQGVALQIVGGLKPTRIFFYEEDDQLL